MDIGQNFTTKQAAKRYENLRGQISKAAASEDAITLKDGRYEVTENITLPNSDDWVILSGSSFDSDPKTNDRIETYKSGEFFSYREKFETTHSREGWPFKKDREYLDLSRTEITPAGNSTIGRNFRL